ncbi:MAG TPA: indolepyruvate ferredoxin oxidoreductase subunit alpha [Ruminiclostridium sp.]|nr:indolepyruvate ferredoxin oxidoreductase subunit alpha [Ruminiclostridium sp.]
MKKLLMGNEAIAFGAIKAGVKVVCGYPGTPSTEVLETVAKNNDCGIYVEWSVNEKAAMELGAGASYSGARVMVTMKQVGLNVASDPLMSLTYIGTKGGMVILVADDPGPNSSQTEQDTRHFAKFSNLPVLDPSTPEEAYEMVQYAFELSEKIGLPVFLRPTTRVCHACAAVDIAGERYEYKPEGFVKSSKWVIFPALAYKKHIELEKQQDEIAKVFDNCRFNSISGGGKIGIAASGIAYAYAHDAIEKLGLNIKLFKVATAYPFPSGKAAEFLEGIDMALVIEELDPVIEEALKLEAYKIGSKAKIFGKSTGNVPKIGELSFEKVEKIIADFMNTENPQEEEDGYPEALPMRAPNLCAGCPHRASFYAVKQAMKGEKAVFTGDIGCYTLGNAKPLDMTDTCLCMGASITVAQGIKRVEPGTKLFAFIGDSTFFHTGIPGIVNALYNGTQITIVVLDNSTTAMTGHQPHPGIGRTMMGGESPKISIYDTLKALGVEYVRRVNPFDQKAAIETAKEAARQPKVSAIVFEAPCIALFKKESTYKVDTDKCKACSKCIKEIGCPAIHLDKNKKAEIDDSLCYGCGLCTGICPFGAIGRVQK